MSSRCVIANSDGACFYVRYVKANSIDANDLYVSSGEEWSRIGAFRPVITLNANVYLDTPNSGNGSTAEQGYAIK